MIKGIGIDLVETERIHEAIQKSDRFIEKLLTPAEQEYLVSCPNEKRRTEYVATRWATKEAFSKAMGTGIGGILSFQDIEVRSHPSGQPYIVTSKFEGRIYLSITDTDQYAAAMVVLEE